MKDSKNAAIAVLSVSATIQGAALVLMHLSAGPAYAASSVMGGDYIMVTGAFSRSADVLYVVDGKEQKLNAYAVNPQDSRFEPVEQVNLKQAFK